MARANPTNRTITVQTGGNDPDSPGYKERPELVCKSVSFRLDNQPSSAVFEFRTATDRQGGPGWTVDDLIRNASYGGWRTGRWEFEDHVRVQIDGTTVFIGQVVDEALKYDDSGVVATITAMDARVMLSKLEMFGRWTRGFGAEGFINGAFPIFNEGGKRTLNERSRNNAGEINSFEAPDAKSNNPTVNAVHWKLIDILDYARSVMDDGQKKEFQNVLGTWNPYVKWSPIGGDDSPSAIRRDLGGDDDVVSGLSIHGMGLPDILNTILGRGGEYHWTLIAEDDAKPTLKIFKDFKGLLDLVLNMANTGQKVQDIDITTATPTVTAMNISRSWRDFYTTALAFGGQRRGELTLSTIDGELVEDWNSIEQQKFLDAFIDPNDEKQWIDTHANVFLQWRIADGIQWAGFFDVLSHIGDSPEESLPSWAKADLAIALDMPRPQRQQLLDAEVFRKRLKKKGAQAATLPKHKILIQRSTDKGKTWEPLPADIQITPLGEIGGFKLGRIARDRVRKGQGTAIDNFTWSSVDLSAAVVYDFRMTAVFDHDAKIFAARKFPDRLENKNIKRKVIRADPKNVYESITRASTRVWVGDEETLDETTLAKPKGAHLKVRDDTGKLQNTTDKLLLEQLSHLPTNGMATIQGTDPEHRRSIGSRITSLSGNLTAIVDTNWGITEIVMTFDPDQSTTFSFGLQ